MKKIILVCLMLLFEQSLSLAASDCRVVEYPDRTEVVCSGVSALNPVTSASSAAVLTAGTPGVVQIDGKAGTYATVQLAYNATVGGDVMKITGETIPGPLLADNQLMSAAVTFKGGCDSSFVQVAGNTTTILGAVRVQQGRVNMDSIKVRPGIASGRLPVNLGTSGNFVILAKSGVSTTGTTAVVGDVGVSPAVASFITGFGLIADSTNTFSTSSLVTGKVYASNYATPTPANMTTAISDMQIAFNDAAGRSGGTGSQSPGRTGT